MTASLATMDQQGDRGTINKLTDLFLSENSTANYTSLRLWFENGELRYFFTNAPKRRTWRSENSSPRSLSPNHSEPVWEPPTESTEKHKRERHGRRSTSSPEPVRQCKSPEIARGTLIARPKPLNITDAENIRDYDLEFNAGGKSTPIRSQAQSKILANTETISVSTYNRFGALDPDVQDDDNHMITNFEPTTEQICTHCPNQNPMLHLYVGQNRAFLCLKCNTMTMETDADPRGQIRVKWIQM